MSEGNGLTAEELAALNASAGEETGLVEDWQYFTLYKKRGNPAQQVVGPFDWSSSATSVLQARGGKGTIVRRRVVRSYGDYEIVEFDQNDDVIEDSKAHALARFLVSLNDPENAEERSTVTLDDLIKRAVEAVGEDA